MRSVDWQRATRVLSAHESIIAAWVFGSAQKGLVGPESDLDIGVLFREPPPFAEWARLRAALQQALQFDAIDLVALNEANAILRFEAVSGRPLFCRDAGHRAAFVSLTAREYEDEIDWVEHRMNRQQKAV